MKKIINDSEVAFYNGDAKILSFDYQNDEFTLMVNTSEVIEIEDESVLFNCLENLFVNSYDFGYNFLNDKKTTSELVWHSDCYYNADDELSISDVSCLHIIFDDNKYKIWCDKKLENILNKSYNSYCVVFSPGGNGRYAKNINTGLSLQNDFISCTYHELIERQKCKKISIQQNSI